MLTNSRSLLLMVMSLMAAFCGFSKLIGGTSALYNSITKR
jgi:hypothetical protein